MHLIFIFFFTKCLKITTEKKRRVLLLRQLGDSFIRVLFLKVELQNSHL